MLQRFLGLTIPAWFPKIGPNLFGLMLGVASKA
jgi:hypothetical protein